MKCILATVILAAATTSFNSGAAEQMDDAIQGGYSTTPLRDPLFDEAQVVVETTAINNWLSANIQKLSYEQMKGPREQLYYLIDSRVKQIYRAEKRVLPARHDPILEILFSWAENLGVFGGAYAFNAVKDVSTAPQVPRMQLPEGIELNLANDTFILSSNLGWSITFPYYFMVWNVREAEGATLETRPKCGGPDDPSRDEGDHKTSGSHPVGNPLLPHVEPDGEDEDPRQGR